jgi:hypothetical protein
MVADPHVDPGGPHAIEHGLFAQVAARHGVAHLGQGDGDRRHPRAAHTDDMQPLPAGQVQRGYGPGVHDAVEARATRSVNDGNAILLRSLATL